jgi:predicted transcriptional regulator
MRSTRNRRTGARLSDERLDYELQRRGLTARQFSRIAKVHEVTLSRARQGHPINENTLRRITAALLQIPVLAGSELLLVGPDQIEEA